MGMGVRDFYPPPTNGEKIEIPPPGRGSGQDKILLYKDGQGKKMPLEAALGVSRGPWGPIGSPGDTWGL